ncbi:YdeI/OmpD-associated family protein [Actinokineospora sp. HUAS TT18]|uniref:YdeI/OmpD-associated family protein n=1 Tax=Actinokineospora sp. HUAS TT18 TaxID=3447451 RepID=UPI003F51AF83
MRFRTTVELGGKTATGFRVPEEVVAGFGRTKRPPVTVTINGHTYRSTVAAYGDDYYLPLSAENRTAAGVAAGDDIEVDVELDTEPRVVEVPPDFAAALAGAPAALAAFEALSYSHKRRHVLAIDDAKTPATRERRIAKAVADLSG